MRSLTSHSLITLFAALALAVSGAACKNNTEKQADKVEAARKNIDEQSKDVAQARRDVGKQQRELDKANADLTAAKSEYASALKDRLAQIDVKITDLEARTDAVAKEAATRLRAERDQLAARIDEARTTAPDRWDAFKKDTEVMFQKAEDAARDAFINIKDRTAPVMPSK